MKYLILVLVTAGALACGPGSAPLVNRADEIEDIQNAEATCPDRGILGDLNGDGGVGLDDLSIMYRQLGTGE